MLNIAKCDKAISPRFGQWKDPWAAGKKKRKTSQPSSRLTDGYTYWSQVIFCMHIWKAWVAFYCRIGSRCGFGLKSGAFWNQCVWRKCATWEDSRMKWGIYFCQLFEPVDLSGDFFLYRWVQNWAVPKYHRFTATPTMFQNSRPRIGETGACWWCIAARVEAGWKTDAGTNPVESSAMCCSDNYWSMRNRAVDDSEYEIMILWYEYRQSVRSDSSHHIIPAQI